MGRTVESTAASRVRGLLPTWPAAVLAAVSLVAFGAPAAGREPVRLSAPAVRPNFLIILTDDQVASNFTRALMPQVFSHLVDHGMSFTRAYLESSLCCPSRSQIMTGLFGHHTGVDDNDDPLGPRRPTVAEALRAAGYQTMLAGKYLNSESCDPHPGWERWVCTDKTNEVNPTFNIDGTPVQTSGYQPDLLAGYVKDFLATSDPSKPFYIEYTPTVPHLPANDPRNDSLVVPPHRPPSYDEDVYSTGKPGYVQRPPLSTYETARADDRFTRMTRVLTPMDSAIGDMLDALGDRAQNTFVLFFSDNGYEYGEHRLIGKDLPYEEAVKTPFVVRYPPLVSTAGASHTSALVENVDVTPTVLDLAGIPWSADGTSLVPILSGQARKVRSGLLIEGCEASPQPCLPTEDRFFDTPSYYGIVTARYKYLEYATGETELYDLRADPYEIQNQAANPAFAQIEGNLQTRLAKLLAPPASPPTTIVAGVSGAIDDRTPSFLFFTPDLRSSLSCRVVGDAADQDWRACSSGVAYGPLPDGSYSFQVRATDPRGHTTRSPATRDFSIATSGPAASVDSGPPDPTDQASASFTFSTPAPGATLQCRLDEDSVPGAWGACNAGTKSYGGLADGDYTFEVRAADAGVLTDPPAFWLFRVDTKGPRAIFDRAPPAVTPDTSAAFAFRLSVPAAGVVKCRMDDQQATRCGHGIVSYSNLSEGGHVFTVQAADQFGQRGLSSYPFTVDRTPPSVASYSVSPTTFTPNGDGVDDTVTLSVTFSEPVFGEIEIHTPGGWLIQRFARPLGTTARAKWDGLDDEGNLMAPGRYLYVITGKDLVEYQGSVSGEIMLASS